MSLAKGIESYLHKTQGPRDPESECSRAAAEMRMRHGNGQGPRGAPVNFKP